MKRKLSSISSSNDPPATTIQYGDMVILYERFDTMHPITITRGGRFDSRLGCFWHEDMIGKSFGSSIQARTVAGGVANVKRKKRREKRAQKIKHEGKAGWVLLLKCDPYLWSTAVKRRTQIIFPTDISVIIAQLHVAPGFRVIESGTGSAALSYAFLSSIGSTGHLFTFEFNSDRVEKAKSDFKNLNLLEDTYTITHRDVYSDGFGIEGVDVMGDALMLDVPQPWRAMPHVEKVLRKGGRICCFSPCIEQVLKTKEEMLKLGIFSDIETYECLERTFDVREETINAPEMDSSSVVILSKEERGKSKQNHKSKKGHLPWVDPSLCKSSTSMLVAKPFKEMRGHTSYLTFATRTI